MKDIVVFSGSAHQSLAQEICDHLGTKLSPTRISRFSNDCLQVQLLVNVRQRDVYIIQPLVPPTQEHLMELLLMIDAARGASAGQITAVIPHYSYARSDKKDASRISLGGRLVADLLVTAGVSRVLTMQLHAPQVQGFFKKPVDHLYAKELLCEYVRRQGIVNEDLVVVSPDAGSAKRAREYATELNCPVAIGDKMRFGHDENAKVLEIIGDVKDKNCLVIDDFSISGGTLVDVSYALTDKGAKKVYAALSHNVLSEEGIKKIDASPIEFLVSTDTLECPAASLSSKIRFISAAPMFAQAVKIIHDRAPMSTMFEQRVSKRLLDMSFAEQQTLL